VFIAAIIGQTKVLAFALRTFQEFESGSKEKSEWRSLLRRC